MKSVHGSGARAIGGRGGGGGMLKVMMLSMSASFTFLVGSAMMLDGFLRN